MTTSAAKDLIDIGAKIVGIGAAVALCFSFTLNAGFFVGMEYSHGIQHLTISDHVTVAIRYLPLAAIVVSFQLATIEYFQRRKQPQGAAPRRSARGIKFILGVIATFALLYVLFGLWWHALAFLLLLAGLFLAFRFVRDPSLRPEHRLAALWVISVAMLFIGSFAVGLVIGAGQINAHPDTLIVTKDNKEMRGRSAFSGEKMLILVEGKTNRILVLPRDTVQRIESTDHSVKRWIPLCVILGRADNCTN